MVSDNAGTGGGVISKKVVFSPVTSNVVTADISNSYILPSSNKSVLFV